MGMTRLLVTLLMAATRLHEGGSLAMRSEGSAVRDFVGPQHLGFNPTDAATKLAPTPMPTRLSPTQKQELCGYDFNGFNRALNLLTVHPKPVERDENATTIAPTRNDRYPRIFCYVNTISPYHTSHAQLVADTWGQRCDKLVFFSNDTGTMTVNKGTPYEINYPIIKMSAPADYWHLWMKHKEVLRYVHDHYRHDYDWFYKADDDAYVVVDNLRDYLKRPELLMNYKRQPIQLGKRFNLTAENVHGFIGYGDKELGDRWWKKWDRWVFNSGGPGYVMNRIFLDRFVAAMEDRSCLGKPWAERQPEDAATSYCMMWHESTPWDTRDLHGRPRWHAGNPATAYDTSPEYAAGWWSDYHQGVGGLKWGDNCCAPDTVGFHYIKGKAMHHVERQLYFCREGDDVADVEAFNMKYGLAISDKILEPPT